MQVIAKGYQTYGGNYDIDKAEKSIEVKLKRPGQQYSIYDNHSEADAAKPPAKDDKDKAASDESAKQTDAKPETTQPQPQ